MRTGPLLLLLICLACAARAQTPQQLLPRQSFADSRAALYAHPGALPEAPAPVWSQKELAAQAGCGLSGTQARVTNGEPCASSPDLHSRFLDSIAPQPLSPSQKGRLAIHNLLDPGNLATIAGSAAFTSLTGSHTAYGPGLAGFGRGFGIGLLGDATGQFFGTFAIPALAGQDPHYHRLPHASVPRRVLHAVSRTVLAQSDEGGLMPNYATLGTYPISAELANLYVPGIHGNAPSTVARILTGYATDPIDNLITEFLPDAARHVHVHVVFAQQLVNRISTDEYPSLP